MSETTPESVAAEVVVDSPAEVAKKYANISTPDIILIQISGFSSSFFIISAF